MTPVAVTTHEKNLRKLRCVVSGTDQGIELHHCHSGSMVDHGFVRGGSQKTNPFFQIPLAQKYHTGEFNPEAIGIRTWEEKFGRQIDHLSVVGRQLGYNVFFQAGGYDGNFKIKRGD